MAVMAFPIFSSTYPAASVTTEFIFLNLQSTMNNRWMNKKYGQIYIVIHGLHGHIKTKKVSNSYEIYTSCIFPLEFGLGVFLLKGNFAWSWSRGSLG
jgi:hypothetical protein